MSVVRGLVAGLIAIALAACQTTLTQECITTEGGQVCRVTGDVIRM